MAMAVDEIRIASSLLIVIDIRWIAIVIPQHDVLLLRRRGSHANNLGTP